MRWEFLHSKASTNPKSLNILRQDYLVQCPIVYANSQKIYENASCAPTPRPSKQPTTREAHKRHRLPCNKVSQPSKFPNPIQNTKEELFCQKIYVSNFWSLSKILQVSQQLRQTITSHPKTKKKMAAILQRSSASIPFVMGPKDLQWGLLFGATTTAGCCTIFGYAAASLSKIGTSNTSS